MLEYLVDEQISDSQISAREIPYILARYSGLFLAPTN
jgi:hypothetical protein